MNIQHQEDEAKRTRKATIFCQLITFLQVQIPDVPDMMFFLFQ